MELSLSTETGNTSGLYSTISALGNELCQKEIKIDELTEEVSSDPRDSRRVSI